jgi:hypothetical protein
MFELYNAMKKWHSKPISEVNNKPVMNIKNEIKFIINYFKKIESDPNFPEMFTKELSIFPITNESSSKYATHISDVYNVSKEKVEQWIDNKRYKTLRNQTMSLITLPEILEKKIKKKMIEIFSFKNEIWTFLWTQRPGQMSALHYDRKKYDLFDLDLKQEDKIKRYIIFLDDQKEGQVFYIGGHFINWKAGDVFSWDQIYFQHGGANFGYHERPVVVVTGVEI